MRITPTYFLVLMLLILSLQIQAQTESILFNTQGGTPNPSAIMEMNSTTRGVLVPRMNETARLTIPSPAQGLLVFQTNSTVGFYYYNGTAWDTLGGATTVTNISNVTNISSSGIAIIRDEKPASTDGGTFTQDAWQKRDLNTLSGDVSFVALSGDSFTLDTGVYAITASAPGYNVDDHQIRLFNTTTSSVAAVGTTVFSALVSTTATSSLMSIVNVGAAGETFVIQHRCADTNLGDGFGFGASWGTNVYTQVKIEKL